MRSSLFRLAWEAWRSKEKTYENLFVLRSECRSTSGSRSNMYYNTIGSIPIWRISDFKEGKTKFNAPNNIRNIDWLPLVPLVKMINPSPKMIMSYHSASFLGDTLCNTHQNRLSSFWCFWSFWRLRWKMNDCIVDPQTETIESGPLCITDLFQNKYVAYCLFITTFL